MKLLKKIFKWLGILLLIAIVVPIVIYWGVNKYEIYKANQAIRDLYSSLEPDMSMKDTLNKARNSPYNIFLWHPGDDGAAPKPVDQIIDESLGYCVLIPREFYSDLKRSYAIKDDDRIGIALHLNGGCYDDYLNIKDVFLLSQDNQTIDKKLFENKLIPESSSSDIENKTTVELVNNSSKQIVGSSKKCTMYAVTTEELNIRNMPGKPSKILGIIKKDDKVCVYDFSGKWGKTDQGWISGKYLTPVKESNTSAYLSKTNIEVI